MPLGETVVMLVTVAGTVATSNLAIGVVLGVLTAMALFARRAAHLVDVAARRRPRRHRPRSTRSPASVFFASDQDLIDAFDYAGDPPHVIVDLSRAHLWDASAVAAMDAIETHYARHGAQVRITGLNRPSDELHETLSGQLAGAH